MRLELSMKGSAEPVNFYHKKPSVSLFATILLIVSLSLPGKVSALLAGDTDGNGSVSIAEVQCVINSFLGLTPNMTPSITITPGRLIYGLESTFSVTGSNLDQAITVTASGACSVLTEKAGGTSSSRTFSCVPSSIGPLSISVTTPTGSVLQQSTMTIPRPVVTMVTSSGTIVIELQPEKAPLTVNNFLQYVHDGFYINTIFHRVVSGFVIQGGGQSADGTPKTFRPPIKLEAPYATGLSNTQGTIAMARTSSLTSATSQFFINTVDNKASLDTPLLTSTGYGYGYAVFGYVSQGMDVVKAIETVATDSNSVPVAMVTIVLATQTQ